MAQHQRFVVLSLPRTGSTYLVDYLDAVPGIKCLSEVFNPEAVLLRHHQPADPALTDRAIRDRDPLAFLHRLEQDVGACDWFGVKLFPSHNNKLLHYFCSNRQWKKIFLWRDNLLEQYISFLLASAQYGRGSWERVADEAQLTVPLGALLDDLHAIEKNYIEIEDALFLAEHEDVFTLEYDDLGNPATMEHMLRFLGVDAATAPNSGKLLNFERGPRATARIANYPAVCEALSHTRYRRWLAA
jgi:LPS sulfotransferase NodH